MIPIELLEEQLTTRRYLSMDDVQTCRIQGNLNYRKYGMLP